MHPSLEKLVRSASDASAFAREWAATGLRHVETGLNQMRVCFSMSALESEDSERDETLYFLVPLARDEVDYVLYVKRVIPSGYSANNSLPKARIFHLPDASAQERMERLLIEQARASQLAQLDPNVDFADRLEALAQAIDEETLRVSGGLLLVGGAVALVNPVVGVSIAAQSLFPSLGSKASKAGASFISDKLRTWSRQRTHAQAEKAATKEVRQLKPELFTNPVLGTLDRMLTNPDPDYDPFLEEASLDEEFPNRHSFAATLEAVGEVYAEVLKKQRPPSGSSLRPVDLDWIRHLAEMSQASG